MEDIICMWIVEKYENSSKYRSDIQTGNMSINLLNNKKYMDEKNYKFRFSINENAIKLEKQNLIKIKWYEKNNIIERILFSIEGIDVYYKISKAIKTDVLLDKAISEIDNCCKEINEQWILDYFSYLKSYMKTKKKLPPLYSNNEKKDLLFKSLSGINEMVSTKRALLQRVFSKKYLKNSKIFENEIRGTLIGIIKKYKENTDDLSDDEILKEFGIEKTANELFLKGNIKIFLNNKVIDLDDFIFGVGLNSQTLKIAEISEIKCTRIISVENKANFIYECDNANKGDVIVFSGGFYSQIQRNFLRKIRETIIKNNINVRYFHSGDFDLGGINIFMNIKSEIFPELQPYKMSLDLYCENKDYGEKFDDSYREKLIKINNDKKYVEFKPLICEIIKNGKKLEQESLLF